MKRNGFVLMETIVVIVVISVALLTIFTSYSKILSKVKNENKYDTSEYIYMTKYIKDYLKNNYSLDAVDICPQKTLNPSSSYCGNFNVNIVTNLTEFENFDVEKIYILTNLNNFGVNIDSTSNLKNSSYFDAYMVDYIKKLDVYDSDELIIVEYKRKALKPDGTPKKMFRSDEDHSLNVDLYETYIASLEW